MRSHRIECSDALELTEDDARGIWVMALCHLSEGDLVATIPKQACLTIKTSSGQEMIEEAGLEGSLGFSVAVMCERSLGPDSDWAGYLQLLLEECVPLVWTLDEVDTLLAETELHKVVKADKSLIYYAKSLVASRSFEIDDFHGYGMMPLADLFNHKTGAENVHFTSMSSHSDTDEDDGASRNLSLEKAHGLSRTVICSS